MNNFKGARRNNYPSKKILQKNSHPTSSTSTIISHGSATRFLQHDDARLYNIENESPMNRSISTLCDSLKGNAPTLYFATYAVRIIRGETLTLTVL